MNSRIESIRRNTRNRITAIGQATGRVLASLLLKALTGTAALGLVVGALWALWGWLFKSSTVVNGALLLGLVLATLFGAGLLAVARWLMAPDSTAHDATPTLDVVELEAVRYIATREKFVRCSEVMVNLSTKPAGGAVSLQHKLNRLCELRILQRESRATSVEDLRYRYRLGPKGERYLLPH